MTTTKTISHSNTARDGGPTDTKGARIRATCDARSLVVSWQYELNSADNHARAAMLLAEKLLAGTSDVRWRFEKYQAAGGVSLTLVCTWKTARGSGRYRFALAPISDLDLLPYLPEGQTATKAIRRTFGRAPGADVETPAAATTQPAIVVEAQLVEATQVEQPAIAQPVADVAPRAPWSDAYVRGMIAAKDADEHFVRGFLDALADLGKLPTTARAPKPKRDRVVVPSDELTERRRAAARKAVETRRARAAGRVDETAHFRCVS